MLTAIGLTPGGSTTVHIYTQTVHKITQRKQNIQSRTYITIRIHKHNNKNTYFTKLNKSIQNIQPYKLTMLGKISKGLGLRFFGTTQKGHEIWHIHKTQFKKTHSIEPWTTRR